MKSVLILQNEMPDYRIPVYNALAENYNITVMHSGGRIAGERGIFTEIVVPLKRYGPFAVQSYDWLSNNLGKFDIVVSMFDLWWPTQFRPLLRYRKQKKILWGHQYSKRAMVNLVRDFLMNRVDGVILYSSVEIETMIKRGIDKSKIFVAPNTIDVPNSRDLSGEEKSSFLYVGRLYERKCLDQAIRAFANIQTSCKDNIVFDIVGAGGEMTELQELARVCGVGDKIKFHGWIEDHNVLIELFRSAAVFVSPGHVGLSVLHSFAYGVPILTNQTQPRTPEFYDLVHGENSYLADGPADLEAAMVRFCSDGQFASRLGSNGYKFYKTERSLENMVAGFKKAFEA